MKKVTISITGDPNDHTASAVTVEQRQGDIWNRLDGRDFVTGKDKELSFDVREGNRIVIEAYPDHPANAVYDKDQNLARRPNASDQPKPMGAPKPVAKPGTPNNPASNVQKNPDATKPGPDVGPEANRGQGQR